MQTKKLPITARTPVSRRIFLAALAGGSVAGGLYLFGDSAKSNPIGPEAALLRVADRTLILIDIRRPDEWALTGVAFGAVPLDMREDRFLDRLDQLTGGDRAAPIALICARGVRSRRLATKLAAAGFSAVLDVSEGMLGSAAGPGWIARGLPFGAIESGMDE